LLLEYLIVDPAASLPLSNILVAKKKLPKSRHYIVLEHKWKGVKKYRVFTLREKIK